MKKIITISLLTICLFSIALPVMAAEWKSLVNCTGEYGSCTLSDFSILLINIARMILGITGSLTLLFFIWGGFLWMMSGGNTDMVNKGKKMLIGAVIGLVIVFSSYMIVNFTLNALTGQDMGNPFKIQFDGTSTEREWTEPPT